MPLYWLLILLLPDVRDEFIKRSHDPYQILCARMLSSSSAQREHAADALAALNPKKAVAPIRMQLFLSDRAPERAFLARILLEFGYSDPHVLAAMEDLFADHGGDAEWLRVELGMSFRPALNARAAPLAPSLLRAIMNGGSTIGGQEACLLVESGKADETAIAEIIQLFKRARADDSRSAKTNCFFLMMALQQIGPKAKDATPVLEAILKEEARAYDAATAAVALLAISPGHNGALSYLNDAAASNKEIVRRTLGWAIRDSNIAEETKVEALGKLLRNQACTGPELEGAFQAMASLGPRARPIVPVAKKYLEHQQFKARTTAAYALCMIEPAGEKPAVQVLVNELRCEDAERSRFAAEYCKRFKDPSPNLLPGLRIALKHSSYSGIADAAKTIFRIKADDPETVQAVTRLLREGVPKKPDDFFDTTALAKGQAAQVIGEFPNSFKHVRKDLIVLLRSSDSMYWPGIARAIAAIDSGTLKKNPIAP